MTNQPPAISNQVFWAKRDLSSDELIGEVEATDPEGAPIIYVIITNDNGLFRINETKGELRLAEGRSFTPESSLKHSITVRINDALSNLNSAQITILLSNRPPLLNQPVHQVFTVKENLLSGTNIGRVLVTDPDGDPITYVIVSNDNDLFELDENSGDFGLVSGKSLDFRISPLHNILIEVSDGVLSNRSFISISVENVLFSLISNIDARNSDLYNTNLAFNRLESIESVTIGNANYLYIGGQIDDGWAITPIIITAIFSMGMDGALSRVAQNSYPSGQRIINNLGISRMRYTSIAKVGTTNFLLNTTDYSEGFFAETIESDGSLGNRITSQIVLTSDLPFSSGGDSMPLDSGIFGRVVSITIDNDTFFFFPRDGNGYNVFSLDNGNVSNITNITDRGRGTSNTNRHYFNGVRSIAIATFNSTNYVISSGYLDHGLEVYRLNNTNNTTNSFLSYVDQAAMDLSSDFLIHPSFLTTFSVAGNTYLGVVLNSGNPELAVFALSVSGELDHLQTINDNSLGIVDSGSILYTSEIRGEDYLLFTGTNGFNVYSIAENGTLSIVERVRKNEHNFEGSAFPSITEAKIGDNYYFYMVGVPFHLAVFKAD